MTVVYIDALFLLNFVVDYLLLLCAPPLAKQYSIHSAHRATLRRALAK